MHTALEREKQELGDATARLGTIEERKRALTRQLEGIKVDIDEWSNKLRDRQEGEWVPTPPSQAAVMRSLVSDGSIRHNLQPTRRSRLRSTNKQAETGPSWPFSRRSSGCA